MRSSALNRKPVVIGNILKDVIGNLESSKKTKSVLIDSIIGKITPKHLREHIKLQSEIKGRIIINVEGPAYLYEANKYKEKILKALEEEKDTKDIREISFRIGKIK